MAHGLPDFAARYLGRLTSRWIFGSSSAAERNQEKWFALTEKLLNKSPDLSFSKDEPVAQVRERINTTEIPSGRGYSSPPR